MKPIFFITIALLITTSSYAQLEKSTWLVGGTGSFYSYTDDYTSQPLTQSGKWTSIDLSASVGYFVIDKLCGGIRPLFSFSKGTDKSSTGTISTGKQYYLSAGPFARYYFLDKNKPFNILTDVCYQLGINQYLTAGHESGKYNIFSAKAGIEAFFNSSAGVEILVGYYDKLVSIEDNTTGAFNDIKKGFQVSIGFQLHLIKD
jgi:hypothetical protein